MAVLAEFDTDRPELTGRDHTLSMLFGVWMVIGLFVDGWAHDNNKPETFFTPWHGLLYSGFGAAAVASLAVVRRHRRPGLPLAAAIPRGHGTTLVALGLFAAAATGDLVWHETLGIEVGVEALLSPTHLALLMSGLVAFSAPLRRSWVSSSSQPESLRAFLPVALSVTLLTTLVGFFLLYVSPFVNRAASAAFERDPGVPHDHPARDPAELLQLLGIASILVTTLLLAVAMTILLRRWHPPAGTFTLMLTTIVVLFVGLDEFAQAPLVAIGLVAGAAADSAARRWPAPAVVGLTMLVLWASYFAVYQVAEGGVAWTAELWSGVTVLSGLLGAAVGVLALPQPAEASEAEGLLARQPG